MLLSSVPSSLHNTQGCRTPNVTSRRITGNRALLFRLFCLTRAQRFSRFLAELLRHVELGMLLSSRQSISWSSPDPMPSASSHSILSAKIHVRSQDTCFKHAFVSHLLICFALHWQTSIVSSLLQPLQRSLSDRCHRETYILAVTLRARAVPSDIRS